MPTVRAKKSCCKDRPRCAKCPVTLQRLAKAGYAERESKRRYDVAAEVPRAVRVAARAR